MCTNTFTPHVGGVARSVERFATEFRRQGHRVLIVAPLFENTPVHESDVVRFPAVQHFNGSDFSVPVPVPRRLTSALKQFQPDIVHSHHPFLLGDMALRVAAVRGVPLVFTHHTLYELYTHYVPGDSPRLKRFVVEFVSGYCNLCDAVIAPSESIQQLLRKRGAKVPIEVIPTGLDPIFFAQVDTADVRTAMRIPVEAFVVGHVGRLAPEKNLEFLAEALTRFLLTNEDAHFLLAGEGPAKTSMLEKLYSAGLESRIRFLGVLGREELVKAYRAMDVFAFASKSETQGMVLTEAMAAQVPVVALDATGVREVVRDGMNGRLLQTEQPESFVEALSWIASLDPRTYRGLAEAAGETAKQFSMPVVAGRALDLYRALAGRTASEKEIEQSRWTSARRMIREEWRIVRNIARAATGTVLTRHLKTDS